MYTGTYDAQSAESASHCLTRLGLARSPAPSWVPSSAHWDRCPLSRKSRISYIPSSVSAPFTAPSTWNTLHNIDYICTKYIVYGKFYIHTDVMMYLLARKQHIRLVGADANYREVE